MPEVDQITKELSALANPEQAAFAQRFFKTGPGQYGAGDVFRGIRVPLVRKLAAKYQSLDLSQIERLLHSAFHEDRLLALLILIRQFAKIDEDRRAHIYDLYLRNTRWINNWDLVDVSAGRVVGTFLRDRKRQPLYRLAASKSLWERRIAIMATSSFIARGEFQDTLAISLHLLADKEDLIHKAVGWMLREVGKKHLPTAEQFLQQHYQAMPRTMLRYAIEKLPEKKRKMYLRGEI